jgi:2-C-methyl-D-erythritol 2,4-cyclodiphosphate synthase
MVRSGIGFDVHKFAVGRKLILGGVEIAFEKGLAGHSDADVVCHAIADALLGAAGLGDIGMMFPDTNSKIEGISSLVILEKINQRLKKENWAIGNIDVTIIAQLPKVAPYSEMMKQAIAKALQLLNNQINIKGKTTEGLGFTGREEGIAAMATATVSKDEL